MVIRAGVIGYPIEHSLSPRIHNDWFRKAGMDGIYEALDCPPDQFEATVRRVMDEGWQGLNVTLPHKAAAAAMADHRNHEVDRLGAANLLVFRDGKIIADNTDRRGFQRCLYETKGPAPAAQGPAIVYGAGGAAGPVVMALASEGDVLITNRTAEKAEALAGRFPGHVRALPLGELPEALKSARALVNTTSLGMTGQPDPQIDLGPMPEGSVVIDIVYSPMETKLLRDARARGLACTNGLTMLVYQAAPSFHALTGLRPSGVEAVLRDLRAELS